MTEQKIRTVQGRVVSDKMDKSITVAIPFSFFFGTGLGLVS